MSKKRKYRAVFISDTHLGTYGCKSKRLNKFLSSIKCDKLYLVGDILDLWRQKSTCWNENQLQTLRLITKFARDGVEIYYTPGNHDDGMTEVLSVLSLPNVLCKKEFVHISLYNKSILVTHGDKFDLLMSTKAGIWIAHLGGIGYDTLIWMNGLLERILSPFGVKRVLLSKFVKDNLKRANSYVGDFVGVMTEYARDQNFHGVICGHIHSPSIKHGTDLIKDDCSVDYYNCGDWIENCTALVETFDGEFKIVNG